MRTSNESNHHVRTQVEHLGIASASPSSPPQGPRRPGQSFDEWFLQGVLIRVENERDAIQEAKFDYRSSGQTGRMGPFLEAAFTAEIHTRKMIEPAAGRVALGENTIEMEAAYLALSCPEYFEKHLDKFAEEVALYRDAIVRQTNLIRWTIKPLCLERQSGMRIIAAATAIGGPLPHRRIVEFCRQVATIIQSRRGGYAGR